MLPILVASLAIGSLAAPVANSSRPSIEAKKGTFIGHSSNGIDSFAGIPFAKPPVGSLRLKPPQPIDQPLGTIDLPTTARACPQVHITPFDTTGIPAETQQYLSQLSPFAGPSGEDCLTVDVQRPAGISKDAKLPVLFWIFGGGNEMGATATYDASYLINTAKDLNEPVIFVAVNYRLSGWGFLGGKELQQDHSTNLGIRDQRAGLEWVADNIAAFGGDSDKVTIWGESGGAYSVFDQLIVNGGDNHYNGKPLFRGAIMDSGSILRTEPVDSARSQKVFDEVAAAAGCGSGDKLTCLRGVPYDKFTAAVETQPDFFSESGLALRFPARYDPADPFFRNSPEQAIASGSFAKVPIIIGNQEDEGTIFALLNRKLKSTGDVLSYLQNTIFTSTPKALVDVLYATYPSDPAAGSPFGTGNANVLYPDYKRLAALLGDVFFTMSRRISLQSFHLHMPTWTYLGTYLHSVPIVGTFHVSDIVPTFYNSEPAGKPIREYVVHFATHLDPNGAGITSWPKWDPLNKSMLNISTATQEIIKDDFRPLSYDVLALNPTAYRV